MLNLEMNQNEIKMNLNAPVSTLMTSKIITVAPTDKLQAAKDIFGSHHIHHIPVCDGEELVGILSKTDYLYFIRPLDKDSNEPYLNDIRLKNYTVSEAMTDKVVSISSSDTIATALEIFTENLFHALPVMEGEKLVGILTTHDILFRMLHPRKALTK